MMINVKYTHVTLTLEAKAVALLSWCRRQARRQVDSVCRRVPTAASASIVDGYRSCVSALRRYVLVSMQKTVPITVYTQIHVTKSTEPAAIPPSSYC